MNVKISTFASMLHENDTFELNNKNFLNSIEDVLGCKLIFSDLGDYDCDLKLIFIKSGGSEGLFLSNFDKLKEPYYFLTSGENNSLAASLEIVTYLRQKGLNTEIIHGDISYIASRIKKLVLLQKVKKSLECTKFGVIGKPSDWLISSIPMYKKVKDVFGIELVDIPLNEVESNYQLSFNSSPIENYTFDFDVDEVNKASNIYSSIDKIVNKYKLDGLTIRCFDLLSSIKSTGCLGLALLNQKGITSSCEGDIMALISMKIASLVSLQSTFQANPSRIDTRNNEIIFAHCTIPFDMCESYSSMTHYESKIGFAIRGKLKKEKVTIFRISADLKNYFVSTGQIEENLEEENLCRTQIRVKMDKDVKELLERPCGNHHIIFYGDYEEELTFLMKEFLK